jgi:hypothetical protein
MAEKNLGGRPTDYKDEYNDMVDEYLSQCQEEWEEFHKTRGEKSDTYEKKLMKVNLPTVEGFAEYLNQSRRVLFKWAEEYPRFMHSLDRVKEAQYKRLIEGGVSGVYNQMITKLILSSNHGMRERNDVTSGDKPIGSLAELVTELEEEE